MMKKEIQDRNLERARANRLSATPDEFLDALERRHGNRLRAWNVVFDPHGTGKVNYVKFCAAARGFGYAGRIADLFEHLDEGCDGVITLDEVDEEAHELVSELKTLCRQQYGGSLCRAWKECLDPGHKLSIDRAGFVEALVERLGFSGNADRLFSLLDFDHSGTITLDELDPVAARAMARGDDELGLDVPAEYRVVENKTFFGRQYSQQNYIR